MGNSGAYHTYYYDTVDQLAVLSINIEACDLDVQIQPPTQVIASTVNMTLGVTTEGKDIIFWTALVGAECQDVLDYRERVWKILD